MSWIQQTFIVQTLTLTFKLAPCFLFPTHRLVRKIFCAKLFINPTMHDKVLGQALVGVTKAYASSLSADCDLDF